MTLYARLHLSENCSSKEIKKAYRKLAMKYHPDKNNSPDAKKKFIEITEAYDILSDPIKRRAYNRLIDEKHKSKEREKQWFKHRSRQAREKASSYAKKPFRDVEKEYIYSSIPSFLSYRVGGCLVALFIIGGAVWLLISLTSVIQNQAFFVLVAIVLIFGAIPGVAYLSTMIDLRVDKYLRQRKLDSLKKKRKTKKK